MELKFTNESGGLGPPVVVFILKIMTAVLASFSKTGPRVPGSRHDLGIRDARCDAGSCSKVERRKFIDLPRH